MWGLQKVLKTPENKAPQNLSCKLQAAGWSGSTFCIYGWCFTPCFHGNDLHMFSKATVYMEALSKGCYKLDNYTGKKSHEWGQRQWHDLNQNDKNIKNVALLNTGKDKNRFGLLMMVIIINYWISSPSYTVSALLHPSGKEHVSLS